MTSHKLHSFFWPESIAVLGASPDLHRIRGRLLHQLRENGFPGRILPINPSYQEIDGQDGTVKAETCDECGSYVKVFYQHKNVHLEPVADDVESLALDQLLHDSAYSRAGTNPYLAGY